MKSIQGILCHKSMMFYDVLIVGAGTTGVYFGWLMAQRGHSVIIIDRDAREKVDSRLEIIHFHKQTMADLGIPPPKEAPGLLFPYKDVLVSRLPVFLQRMYTILEAAGAHLEFLCEFRELLYENRRIIGVKAIQEGKSVEFLSRLVVDASGVACAVRSSLPNDYGVENWKYESHNRFFVILHYIKWQKPNEPHPEWGDIRPYYLAFFDPGYTRDEAIWGIPVPESFEKAAILFNELLKREQFPPFEIKKKEYGSFTYSRPPYSLVGDGFFCAGDSAAMTHPIAARGIAETWRMSKLVDDVIDHALRSGGYVSKELLWEVNVRYFRGDGADHAYLFILTSLMYRLTEKEMNFLFTKVRSLFDPKAVPGNASATPPNEMGEKPPAAVDFKISVGIVVKIILQVLAGLFTGKVSFQRVGQLLKANKLGNKLKTHYKNFPDRPEEFDAWVLEAKALWKLRTPVTKQFESTTITYPTWRD